ncbi:MAG TPA: hypothetical protein VIA18_17820 [Polyangia bacterium]|nr:hypothetical protein [Polyangia bacterium]
MFADRHGATLLACVLATTTTTTMTARADETVAMVAPVAPEPAQLSHAESPIADALARFDFGDYEAVVNRLRPIVENGARELPLQVDRIEALRVYGIACTLTDRKTAAEGAFLLLLREEPQTRLDPRLVRPEAVAFFEEVRARHREELLAVYRRSVPRYNWALDLVPAVGQFQNHQRVKGFVLGGLELALLGGTIVTYSLLTHFEGHDHTFAGHESLYTSARGINITCFTALLAVTAYGIIDAFVVGGQRRHHERDTEARLLF